MQTNDELRNAADAYRRRHSSTRGGKTSLKRFIRAARIEAGLRPMRPSRRYTADQYFQPRTQLAADLSDFFALLAGLKGGGEGTFARLHPTKGFRFGNAI